ncbi:EF-hand domain-containing protein [Falsiruegeria mediterranea]|jgi:Ca2+-binding EF-hand superfamily protein
MKHAGFIAAVVIAAAGVTGTAVLAKGSHATFQELDADGNGEITQAEMEAHRTARFAKADTDGDGKLSLEEATAKGQERAAKRAEKMFERHDANKDGFLDAEELPKPRRAGKFFDRMDKDGSGGISEAEFAEARERMKEHRKKRGHQDQD